MKIRRVRTSMRSTARMQIVDQPLDIRDDRSIDTIDGSRVCHGVPM